MTLPEAGNAPIPPATGGITLEALQSLDSMEGVYSYSVVELKPAAAVRTRPAAWPGYLLAAGITAASYAIHYFPAAPFRVTSGNGVRYPVSASILAILLGIALRNLSRLPR